MGLTKGPESYYVEFRVRLSADGKSVVLASGIAGARKKRWKVGCLNKTVAREMEVANKTRLLLGKELSKGRGLCCSTSGPRPTWNWEV